MTAAEAREAANDQLEWSAGFYADTFDVRCQRCRAPFHASGHPIAAPAEFYGLLSSADDFARALLAALDENEQRMTRESGQALIEDASRWERAYRRERDENERLREALRPFAEVGAELHEEMVEDISIAWRRGKPSLTLSPDDFRRAVAALSNEAER